MGGLTMKIKIKNLMLGIILLSFLTLPAIAQWEDDEDIPITRGEMRRRAETKYIRDHDKDTFRYFENTEIDEREMIKGNIVVMDGDLTIEGEVDGDVLVIFGDVEICEHAAITGNITSIGGQISQDENSIVNGNQIETSRRNIIRNVGYYSNYDDESWRTPYREKYSTLPLGYFEESFLFRYNRVQGLFLGFELPKGISGKSQYVTLHGFGGYGFREKAWRYQLGFDRYFFNQRDYRFELGFRLYDLTDTRDDWIINPLENSLAAILIHEDFQDFYRRHGFEVHMSQNLSIFLKGSLFYRNDNYESQDKNAEWALFGGKKKFRENPNIDPGNMRSLVGELYYDTRNDHEFPRSGLYGKVSMEVSNSELRSDFNFNQYVLDLRHYLALSRGEQFDFRIKLGSSEHTLPLQKHFQIGGISTLRGFSYKEFVGDRLILANIEYHLSPSVFHRDILFFDDLRLIVFSDIGNAWFSEDNSKWTKGFSHLKFDDLKSNLGFAIADWKGHYRLNFAKRTDTSHKPFEISFRISKPF